MNTHFSLERFSLDRSIGYLIKRVGKLSTSEIERRFAGRELTLTHWIALAMLLHGIADNCASLARRLGHDSGAMTRLIDQLAARGLVDRQRGNDDRRVVKLDVTPAGREQFKALTPILLGVWNEAFFDFEATEVETLIRLLSRLVGALEAREAAAEMVSG